jgi:hypothetical protein
MTTINRNNNCIVNNTNNINDNDHKFDEILTNMYIDIHAFNNDICKFYNIISTDVIISIANNRDNPNNYTLKEIYYNCKIYDALINVIIHTQISLTNAFYNSFINNNNESDIIIIRKAKCSSEYVRIIRKNVFYVHILYNAVNEAKIQADKIDSDASINDCIYRSNNNVDENDDETISSYNAQIAHTNALHIQQIFDDINIFVKRIDKIAVNASENARLINNYSRTYIKNIRKRVCNKST